MGTIMTGLGIGGGPQNGSDFVASSPTNQSQINAAYQNSALGLQQQQDLYQALLAQNGMGGPNSVFNQQKQLADALLAQSQGYGPNPAKAQTMANAQQLAGQTGQQLASARGINPTVAAMMIAQNSGQAGQNVAAQGAALQAQQQLAAQQQLQAQQQTMIGQQQNALNAFNQASQNQYGQLTGAAIDTNRINQSQSAANTDLQGRITTGLIGGAAAAASGGAKGAKGGEVFANEIKPPHGENPKLAKVKESDRFSNNIEHPHLKSIAQIYYPHFSMGAVVPGKAEVRGDSEKNDKVPAMLSPKEIVLPRSITLAPDAPEKAREFVADLLKKHGEKNGRDGGEHKDFKAALREAISKRKNKTA